MSTPANGGYSLFTGAVEKGGGVLSPGRCDDCAQQINLGFGFEMFATVYTSCYSNNNGIISFLRPIYAWVGGYFPLSVDNNQAYGPVVAPFWADVNTSNPASGRIWYKLYPDRLVVLWNCVGYFSGDGRYGSAVDKKNTFQLILRRNTVAPAPANDVTFAYGQIQ